MKERLLEYLCCPDCRGGLRIENPRREQGEIYDGCLVCTQCRAEYPVSGGIPRFIPAHLDEVVQKNVQNFGDQWHLMKDLSEVNRREFASYLETITPNFFKDKLVLDAGCGMGKFLYYAASWGARDAIGVDLSKSVEVAYRWTREVPNAHVVQGDIYNLPLRDGFDFIYSIGVLHHLPDPEGGFQKLVALLRRGGKVLAWVYSYEGNELYIKLADPLRRVTSRLPLAVNKLAAQAIAAFLWTLICAVYVPADRLGLKRLPFHEYFLYFREIGFMTFWGTVLDKMTPAISCYHRREEFEQWFSKAGLPSARITQRNGNSWRGESVKA